MALDNPTNRKAMARFFLKHVVCEVRETGQLVPPVEYKALAKQIGLSDSQVDYSSRVQEGVLNTRIL
jgi:hypothetical protein